MNSTPQYIYNLITFSQDHMEAENDKYIKAHAEWEIIKLLSKEDQNSWRISNAATYISNSNLLYGKAYRGSWLDLDDLLLLISERPSYICEDYYEWLCIERHRIGELDAYESINDTHPELWFKLSSFQGDMKYMSAEKPYCFNKTISFT